MLKDERQSASEHKIEPDVLRFFIEKNTPFGCANVLDVHFPTTRRVSELVCNALTVEFAISRAYNLPAYEKYISDFAVGWGGLACGNSNRWPAPELDAPGWFSPPDGTIYARHIEKLRGYDPIGLQREVDLASRDCIDAIHLFSAKQCNMACVGCYASAIPIDKYPYKSEDVDYFYTGAQDIIAAARSLGAKTVQTSGDGELTVYPRFFELLEWVASQGLQWLIFTAGLIFSSEKAAVSFWSESARQLSSPIRRRIQGNIDYFTRKSDRKPTVSAFLQELARHKDHLHIYHSVWSANSEQNTSWRKPRVGDYEYVKVDIRGTPITLPSSVIDLMAIFSGEHRSRLGIDFPVSESSVVHVPALAAFVADHKLKSYFEPIITTGRARRGRIGGQTGGRCTSASLRETQDSWTDVAALMVRSNCSFRFIHQPIVKYKSASEGFFSTPGTGVDLDDLGSLGVLASTNIERGGLFGSFHSPLIVHANYSYVTGCKCNDFSQRMLTDRRGLAAEWNEILRKSNAIGVTSEDLSQRLRCAAQTLQ